MSSAARSRERRAARIERIRKARCPDCSSRVQVLSDGPGGAHLRVEHDETCPRWRARGSAPHLELFVRRRPW